MANLVAFRSDNSLLGNTASKLHLIREDLRFPTLELPALKHLLPKGLPRGIIAEVNGLRSSGRTSVCLHILAQATACGNICAVIDLDDNFDPVSATGAGVYLNRVVWVRCQGNAEHAMRAADLLLHAGGFGVVLLDLCEAQARVLNRIPLSYWHRFRRVIEHTPTVLLVCAQFVQAKSCASSSLEVKSKAFHWTGKAPFLLLRGWEIIASLRKPALRVEPLSIRSVA